MQFFRQILSSDSDQGSFSRLSGLLIILALIAWATLIILRIPVGTSVIIPDVPEYWMLLVVALYGINKSLEAAKVILPAIKGKEVQVESDQPA
jgi:hypothetical protein